jgi:hypothetical protein
MIARGHVIGIRFLFGGQFFSMVQGFISWKDEVGMFFQEVIDLPKLDLEIFKVHNTEGLSLDKVVMGGSCKGSCIFKFLHHFGK